MKARAFALASIAVLLVALPVDAQRGSLPKWWQSEPVRTDLGLTAEQSKELEDIYQASLPKLRGAKDALDQAERTLSRTIAEASAEEFQVVQQINQVESARSELGQLRTLMLYRMQRVLTPEQRVKMKERHERGDKSRRDRRN